LSCSFDGCERPVEKAGLCAAHRKQKVRGQTLRPLRTRVYGGHEQRASDRLERAALAFANAESDEAYARARVNLQDAARYYGTGIGKSPAVSDAFAEVRAALRKLKVRVQ
jgi:hypothetical protein